MTGSVGGANPTRADHEDPVVAFLRAVAAWDLPGSPPIVLPTDPAHLDRLASELQRTRLLGVALAAESLGEVSMPEELHDDLVRRHEAALLWCLELESRLLEVADWFDRAGGVEFRVIKGPAIAHLDALEPSLRTFADIDLLVAADDLDRAIGVLEAHGATRPWAQRRSGWDRRFAKSVTMTFGDGIELDVHRMLADGAHGHRIPLAELFDSAPTHADSSPPHDTDFDIGGVTFRALRPEHRLLHSAYHLLLGSREPALMNLRDFVVYLNDENLFPQQVVAQVERWGGTDVLAMALDLVADRLAVTPRPWLAWRSAYRVDPSEVELIERHRNEGSSLGRAKIDVARELEGVRDRVAYLSALVWPSRGHLESRGLSRRDMVEPLMDVFGRRLRRSR